ncbi:Copia protein, partial [Mucuna pruriens]
MDGPMKLYFDNKSTISIAHNPIQHDRTKHMEVDRHFIKEKLDSSLICTPYVLSQGQLANILTKGFCLQFQPDVFWYFLTSIHIFSYSELMSLGFSDSSGRRGLNIAFEDLIDGIGVLLPPIATVVRTNVTGEDKEQHRRRKQMSPEKTDNNVVGEGKANVVGEGKCRWIENT